MRSYDRAFEARMPVHLPYRVYAPESYDDQTRCPLLIFLHGAGARGDDLNRVEQVGLPTLIENTAHLPLIVAAPQCPRNLDWSTILPALDSLIDHLLATLPVDADRVYLTGLSMGGFGVWALATEYPERFAAIAPICGGGRPLLDFPERLRRIVHLPVWAFHGEQDDEIPVAQSDRLVEALRNYGGAVTYTVYSGVGHDSWTQTYRNPELYAWLLRQTRVRPNREGTSF